MALTSQSETPLSGENYNKLAESLDKDVDDFMGKLEKKPYTDGFTEDNWEQEMQFHPAFRSEPFKPGEELPPLFEAFQQLKYDAEENSPEELAINYKDDGNYNFKLKKYHWAIQCYSEALKIKCGNATLNAQLFTNRAAAHYHLGNYRSSLNDCQSALKLQENHIKAIIRAALCCLQLGHYLNVLNWCDKGLKINSADKQLIDIKIEAEKQQKIVERDKRKEAVKQNKLKRNDDELLTAISKRGIQIMDSKKSKDKSSELLSVTSLEPCHPSAIFMKVHLDEQGRLIWPVMFVYPEYGQTDFIQNFNEEDNFYTHFNGMFGANAEKPQWDNENKYIPENLEVYFEEEQTNILWNVRSKDTLLSVLQHPKYVVTGGTPLFVVVVRGSDFATSFIKKFDALKSIRV